MSLDLVSNREKAVIPYQLNVAEKTIPWIEKHKKFFSNCFLHRDITSADIINFKASELGKKFSLDNHVFKKLNSPNVELPEEFKTPTAQRILDFIKIGFQNFIQNHDEQITRALDHKFERGICFGEVFSLAKHLILKGGSIAKLKMCDLNVTEQIFFQLGQYIYLHTNIPAVKHVKNCWSDLCEAIQEDRQKRSWFQKFLHRNERIPDPAKMPFNFSQLVANHEELLQSLFFQFPKPLVFKKLLPKDNNKIDPTHLAKFLDYSESKIIKGAVIYCIAVTNNFMKSVSANHIIMLHCNAAEKVFEFYEPRFGAFSFGSHEEMFKAVWEFFELEKLETKYALNLHLASHSS